MILALTTSPARRLAAVGLVALLVGRLLRANAHAVADTVGRPRSRRPRRPTRSARPSRPTLPSRRCPTAAPAAADRHRHGHDDDQLRRTS